MTWLAILELVFAAIAFPILIFVPAPYGRYLRDGWGPTMDARAGWIVMELPAVVVPVIMFLAGGGGPGIVLLLAWELHYVQRTFVFPLRMRGPARRKPVLTVALAFGFNVLNGTINGHAMTAARLDPVTVIGLLIFLGGLAINLHSDAVLRGLRAPGETGYRIPRGGLFRWVSAANYTGEIIEWIGFAIAGRSLPALAFAVFTFANLVPRAIAHHRFYRERFPDYPPERRAVFPFLL